MKKDFKIKVCGMKNARNISDLIELDIDYIGFIFYQKSKRYLSGKVPDLNYGKIEKVGVFVDESFEKITNIAKTNGLDVLQLHGDESVEFCTSLKNTGYKIWKVFSVSTDFDFDICKQYTNVVDAFLFDTKGAAPGGNGIRFDWDILQKYSLDTPFLLSGGIGIEHIDDILNFDHDKCTGIDINSGFEINAGNKDIEKIKRFIEKI